MKLRELIYHLANSDLDYDVRIEIGPNHSRKIIHADFLEFVHPEKYIIIHAESGKEEKEDDVS
jgi:hypothetical protein